MNWEEHIISDSELAEFLPAGATSLAERLDALIAQQKKTWRLARQGNEALSRIETRVLVHGDSRVIVQHNPGRLISTTAAVDAATVKDRPCFLCSKNLPAEEKGIAYEDLVILCNPFPIVDGHFTVAHREHIPQSLDGRAGTILSLAREVAPSHLVLYNGPECGASAPDHLHFQICSRRNLPIERDLAGIDNRLKASTDGSNVQLLHRFERSTLVIEGRDADRVARVVHRAVDLMRRDGSPVEPMFNLICAFDGHWTVYLFPRSKHRPSSFSAETDERLTISPGALDMAGMVVVPEREHFNRLDAEKLSIIFAEVSIRREEAAALLDGLRKGAG